MYIAELMSHPAITCSTDDTLNKPAQLMWERDCGAVPVVYDDGRLAGMITDRDICMAAYTHGTPLHAVLVSDVMSVQTFWCHSDQSVDAAERLMAEKQVRRVPILDRDQRPIGMLSLNDIARQAALEKQSGSEHQVIQTLVAIGQPRARRSAQTWTPTPGVLQYADN